MYRRRWRHRGVIGCQHGFPTWLGDTALSTLIDDIADGACAVMPAHDPSLAREIADLIFRTCVRQTTGCTRHGACSDTGPAVWGGYGHLPIVAGKVLPCEFKDAYPHDLPYSFAVAAANATIPLGGARDDALEDQLATAFRQSLAPYLFENQQCGHSPICDTTSSDPFVA